jgi:ribosomal protein L17
MRKRVAFRKLGMNGEHRWAMLRNMVTSLIHHERIMTTTARAKELRRVAEKMITHAKKGNHYRHLHPFYHCFHSYSHQRFDHHYFYYQQ